MLGAVDDIRPDELRVMCCRGRWRALGEVRAAQAYGVDRRLTNIEVAVWTRRLAYELGCFQPVPVPLAALDADMPSFAHRVLDGFALLIGLRWKDYAERPVPYTVRFAAAWCGVGHRQAHVAISLLRDSGVIREVDRAGRGGRRYALYLPQLTVATMNKPVLAERNAR
jgi:hypothetical protein